MEEIVKVIRVDTKGSGKTINQLKKEIKQLKTELESTTVGSAQFEAKLRSLAQVQQQYASINMDMAVKTQGMEKSFKNLAQFGGNLTKSFSSINAMVGLLGGNVDDANKALLKVAQTMQLVQGISGFGQVLGQLPKIIAQFKNWAEAMNPINSRVNNIAKDLNSISPTTLRALESISRSGSININTGSSRSSASATALPSSGTIKNFYPGNTGGSSAGSGDRMAYTPKLIEEQKTYIQQLKQQKAELEALRPIQENNLEYYMSMKKATEDYNKAFNAAISAGVFDVNNPNTWAEGLKYANAELGKLGYTTEDFIRYWESLKQEFGKGFTPKDFTNNIKWYEDNIQGINKEIQEASDEIKDLDSKIKLAEKSTNKFGAAWKAIGGVIKAAIGAIAVTAAITMFVKLWEAVEKNAKAAKEAREAARAFNVEITKGASGASKNVVVLQELSRSYQKVGDSAESKKKFLEDYADKIKETGIAVVDVNTADDVFIKNTDKYIKALQSRAKAQAAENLAIQKYQEYLEKRVEAEDRLVAAQRSKDSAEGHLQSMIDQGFGGPELGPISEQISKAIKEINKAQNELNDLDTNIGKTIDKLFDVVETENAAADAVIKPLEDAADAAAKAKADAEAAAAKAKAKKEEDDAIRKKELEELAKYYKAARDLFKDARTKELDDIREKYDAQIELAKKYGNDTTALELARQREIADVIKKYSDQALKDQEEATQKQIDALQTQIERIRKMNDTSNLRYREQNYQTEYRQPGITSALGLGAAWKNVYQSKDDVDMQLAKQLEYNNKILELTRSRIEQENEILNKQLEVVGLTADQKWEIERTLAENEIALSDAIAKNEEDNLNAYLEHQQKRQQAMNATLEVASSVFGSMASIAQASMNAEIKTEGKTTTELEKAKNQKIAAANTYATLSISQAIVDTYKAANESYSAMASIPYVGPALGAAAAGAAVIAGIANVKQIIQAAQQAKLNASASISMSSGASTTPPAALGTNPITYTRNLLGDKETEELNNPIKCYVLESEITKTQNKVAVTEQNASF